MAEPGGPQRDPGIPLRTSDGAMNPDHPMLQRAQQALARQLTAKRMRVEGELREKQTALQVPYPVQDYRPGIYLSVCRLSVYVTACACICAASVVLCCIYSSSCSLPVLPLRSAVVQTSQYLHTAQHASRHVILVFMPAACQEAARRSWS